MTSAHDKYAQDYDRQIEEYGCFLAEVLFGLSYEFVFGGEKVLDIGIGTGLSSILFKKAGAHIFGMDGSKEMLSICRGKGIADELVDQDILSLPWPYPDISMNHIISCGVFHFMGDLDGVFSEIQRIHMRDGIFAFTVKAKTNRDDPRENYLQQMEDGIPIYSHSREYIEDLLRKYGYINLKQITALVGDAPFIVIASRKG